MWATYNISQPEWMAVGNNMYTPGVKLNTCYSTGDSRMCSCSQKLTAVQGASFHHSWAITISHYWARIYIVLKGT